MNIFLSAIGFLLVIGLVKSDGVRVPPKKEWGYLYPKTNVMPGDWGSVDGKCNGKVQSPINVKSEATLFDSQIGPIEIKKVLGGASETWKVENNGHGVKYTPLDSDFEWVMQPSKETFKLLQMHFHWRGSEHLVDDHKFAGELHLVTQSKSNQSQYSVIGFLIKMVDSDNMAMKPLIDDIPKLREAKSEINATNFKLMDLIPMKVKDFFRYTGSLTTPTCDEIVEWNLVNMPLLTLSENQLVQLQTLKDKNGDALLTNSRPIQPINGRVVKRSFNQFEMYKAANGELIEKKPEPKPEPKKEECLPECLPECPPEKHVECKPKRKRMPKC